VVRVLPPRGLGALLAALAAALALPIAAVGQDGSTTGAPVTTRTPPPSSTDYRIGPLDKLNIVVFQVKDLSVDNLQVDATGQVLLPLIGAVQAGGRTTAELSGEIADRLRARYLQSPQVSVTVAETASQKITVEGAVNDAGVFELKGRTSLLEAVARAKGVSKAANAHRVAIVRNVDGAPHAATFDLAAIGAGKARDPEVIANDVVIVDTSRSKSFWHGMVEVFPALYLFTFL
jgi:polysaccharide export outer membrane protein